MKPEQTSGRLELAKDSETELEQGILAQRRKSILCARVECAWRCRKISAAQRAEG